MIITACIDQAWGMMFHERRQSQDRLVRADIMQEAHSSRLWMNHYSAKQFSKASDKIWIDEDFMNKAAKLELCFIENIPIKAYESKIEKIILYNWNKKYPADFHFDLVLKNRWQLSHETELTGFSHPRIIKSVYLRSKQEASIY